MLEVSSTLPSPSKADDEHAVGGFLEQDVDCGFMVDGDSLLDYLDFTACCDDVVVPSLFDADGDDILPDLEVDPATEELLAEFELDQHQQTSSSSSPAPPAASEAPHKDKEKTNGDEVLSGVTSEEDTTKSSSAAASAEAQKSNKKTTSKNSHGNKKKVKVEWTPELHRKFVQAVEQLGIDKAVPSRILEIMGSKCLTRHNIASHLQKYRSHRKHVMAREAEAATWAQKRQMMRTNKDSMPPPPPPSGPWVVPTTIGFPFGVRPLHVWGHPRAPAAGVEAPPPPVLPVWPRHLAPPPWVYWQQYNNNNAARKWGPTQGTTCVPPPPPPAAVMLPRFPAPAGMTMYRPPMIQPPSPPQMSSNSSKLRLQLDAHPSKESIDAAIGDVLVKPWLPLPLGLKPPSLDSVMSELHKQGIPSIPIIIIHPDAADQQKDHACMHHSSTPR